jgi:hypothetical protein
MERPLFLSLSLCVALGMSLAAGASAGPPCAGDCDENGSVTIAELLSGVSIALGNADLSRCRPADLDDDGSVAVNELIQAVDAALAGCGAHPTPPATGAPAQTPNATATRTPREPDETPAPAFVSFTDYTGAEVEVVAYSGRVFLVAGEAPVRGGALEALIAANGGRVLEHLESDTGYLIEVTAGSEGEFIAAVTGFAGVLSALPQVVVEARAPDDAAAAGGESTEQPVSARQVIGPRVQLFVLDDYTEPVNQDGSLTHGGAVRLIASDGLAGLGASIQAAGSFHLPRVFAVPFEVAAAGDRVLINFSIQGATRHPVTGSPLAEFNYRWNEAILFLQILSYLASQPAQITGNLLVVLSAGNGPGNATNLPGINLDLTIDFLRSHSLAVQGFIDQGHVLFVGGTAAPGECFATGNLNFSRKRYIEGAGGLPYMVYRQGLKVQVPGRSDRLDGTSFAAPLLTNEMARLFGENPERSVSELVHNRVEWSRFRETCLEGDVTITKVTHTDDQGELRGLVTTRILDTTSTWNFHLKMIRSAPGDGSDPDPVTFFTEQGSTFSASITGQLDSHIEGQVNRISTISSSVQNQNAAGAATRLEVNADGTGTLFVTRTFQASQTFATDGQVSPYFETVRAEIPCQIDFATGRFTFGAATMAPTPGGPAIQIHNINAAVEGDFEL